jgi:hypothetical protein
VSKSNISHSIKDRPSSDTNIEVLNFLNMYRNLFSVHIFQMSLKGTSKSNHIFSCIPFKDPTQLTTQSVCGVPCDATSVH